MLVMKKKQVLYATSIDLRLECISRTTREEGNGQTMLLEKNIPPTHSAS